MRKFIAVLVALSFSLLLHAVCSNTYQKVFINEVNTKDNFIEIYAPPATAHNEIYSVKACTSTTDCVTKTYTINGTTSWYLNDFNLINNRSDFDITLYAPDGNISDYIRIGDSPIQSFNTDYTSCPSIASNVNTSSHTFVRSNSGQRDFYRYPDGSLTWDETNWGNNTKGTSNIGTVPITYCTSFQYELYHPLSSVHKLQTRIAQQAFDLNVSVTCAGTGTIPSRKIQNIYAFSGGCPTATANLPLLWNGLADINDTLTTITLTVPATNNTKAYSNIRLLLETNASELNCSVDNMAIRPSSFNITSPGSLIKASDFNLSVSTANIGSDYNGTAAVNASLQESNPNCPTTSDFVTSTAGNSLDFVNDTNTTQMKATDAGGIYLNIKDSAWTLIDQPNDCISDSNSTSPDTTTGLFGCNIENNLSLRIIPHHFDINATLSNANNGTFTYLSNDLNMSAKLDLNVTAKTADGNTTKNYNTGCYAKPTNYTINYTTPTITPVPNLTKLNYQYIDLNSTNISNLFFNIDANETIFTTDNNGTANLSVKINFDRSASKLVNPFDFNITSATANDTDSVSGVGVPTNTAKFVYGRIRGYDIQTDQNTSVPNPIEIEIYDTNTSDPFISGKPQNVLYWYRNTDHNSTAEGTIIKGGFLAGENNSNVVPSTTILKGIQNVAVTSSAPQTVHLDISPWLWYSSNPLKNYNYATDCTQHPCFQYQYIYSPTTEDKLSLPLSKGVNTGTFGGSDFGIIAPKKTTKKGIKVFR